MNTLLWSSILEVLSQSMQQFVDNPPANFTILTKFPQIAKLTKLTSE